MTHFGIKQKNNYFLKQILEIIKRINKKITNNISGVRILEKVRDFSSIKFEA